MGTRHRHKSDVGIDGPPLRCAIYVRISHDPTKEELGVERQLKACRELAEQRGWQVYDVYRDNDLSAYNLQVRRLDYERMVRDIERGHINAIVAFAGDRIHRRLSKLTELIDLLNKHNVDVATVTGGYLDLSNAQGRAFAQVIGILAEMESAIKSERIALKHEELAEAGKWSGGPRRFGYSADGMEIIEEEAEALRFMADSILDGKSLRRVARDLNERGIRKVRGGLWTHSDIRALFAKRHHTGTRVYRGQIIDAEWPAIIAKETWQAVNVLLDHNGATRSAPRPSRYLLSGLLYGALHPDGSCNTDGDGFCLCKGEKIRGAKNPRGVPIYLLKARGVSQIGNAQGVSVRASAAEAVITEAVLMATDATRLEPPARMLPNGNIELTAIDAEIGAIKAAHEAGDISTTDVIDLLRPLNKRRRDAETLLAEALASVEKRASETYEPGQLRRVWPQLSLIQKQEALSECIEYVTVMPAINAYTKGENGRRFNPERLRVKWRYGHMPLT